MAFCQFGSFQVYWQQKLALPIRTKNIHIEIIVTGKQENGACVFQFQIVFVLGFVRFLSPRNWPSKARSPHCFTPVIMRECTVNNCGSRNGKGQATLLQRTRTQEKQSCRRGTRECGFPLLLVRPNIVDTSSRFRL